MTSHAIFSPSSAHRWLYCPLSLKLEERERKKNLPTCSEEESEEARQGTIAHEKLSKILSSYYNGNSQVVVDISDPYVNEVVSDIINTYPKDKYDVRSEVTLYLNEFMYGTCDVYVNKKGQDRPCAILDFKYGEVPVRATQNAQLLMYAYLATKLFGEIEDFITLGIYQPRTPDHKIDLWSVIQEVIDLFELRLQDAAKYYYEEPSTHRGYPLKQVDNICKYCPVKYTSCPHTLKAVGNLSQDLIVLNDIKDLVLKSEQEIFLLKNRTKIVGYLDELHARYKIRLQSGEDIKGLKLTKDREIKKWKDEDEAKRIMEMNGINPYTVKLKTPSQVIKETKDTILGIESFIEVEKKGSYIVED